MSTTSGFVLGVVTAATLTVLYGDKLSSSLSEVVEQLPLDMQLAEPMAQVSQETSAPGVQAVVSQHQANNQARLLETVQAEVEAIPAADEPAPSIADGPNLEQRWAEFAAQAETLEPAGEFPWRACFARAAASYELPETLLLAIASGESNFDPAARSDKDAVGLMQILWPGTSRHLGVLREADLYDPCTNVDAGARYLVELAARFDNNLHLMVAAYNYGPGRIDAGHVPDGAQWYSQYIYQHLQQVLGKKHIATSELIQPAIRPDSGYQVLMRFDRSQRARDFKAFVEVQIPGLNVQQRSEALGQHDVVLLYQDETERQRALSLINAAGIATLEPTPHNRHYL